VVEDNVLLNFWNGVQAGESKSGTVTIRATQIFVSRICHKTPIIEWIWCHYMCSCQLCI